MEWENIKLLASISIVFFLLLVPLGSLGISFFCELGGKLKRKILLDKLANQLAKLSLLLSLGIGLSIVLISFLPSFSLITESTFWVKFWQQGLIFLAGSVLFTLFYNSLWKTLKNWKWIHLFLVVCSVTFYKLFLFYLFRIIYAILTHTKQEIIPFNSIFYPLLGQLFILSFVFAVSIAFIYLIIRRSRDDFGRDYYKYSFHVLSKWGILFLILSIIPCLVVFLLLQEKFIFAPIIKPAVAIVLVMLVLLSIFYWLLKQNQPLRYKGIVLLLPFASLLLLFFRLVSYLELIKMAGL